MTSRLSNWRATIRAPYPWSAVVLGAALVTSTALFSEGMVRAIRIKHQDHRISVTGSATRSIRSDLIVWKAYIKSQASDTAGAYKKLAGDLQATQAWLREQGVEPSAITASAISIEEVHPRDKEGRILEDQISSYRMSQSIEISSGEIDKITRISRAATELIDRGINIQSEPPLYIYTKLSELKVQLLADASRDARQRADQIAKNTGSKVGSLVSAKMGVLQINPAHVTEVSWSGNNDKTSLDKDAMAVVTASFLVD